MEVFMAVVGDGIFFFAAHRVDNRFVQGLVGTYEVSARTPIAANFHCPHSRLGSGTYAYVCTPTLSRIVLTQFPPIWIV
ncbi:hypothetical protein ANCDUO_25686 [Ancylostoma duodenale]|uniref:Uncharacterized protein n=1 Tax=Ancylostoma duodenale TaxID=51022 RepID=A0A0C2FH96_9BILA|nr:hypothetical protein ANCDUO_25686 [Ancylostoma duodenale]